ncbi:MAG TPA: hypothetical protein VFE37_02400 [Chloroflexota bacterium]|nr:hypothetical protein [Chloroflexota bacterium]
MRQPPAGPRYPLTYQEALRSVGALLDAAVAGRATLRVSGDGIEVDAPGGFGRQLYSWRNVVALSEARASLRGKPPTVPRPYLTSWESLLRLAGRALGTTGLARFELHAAVASEAEPTRCYLEVTVEGKRVLGETEVIEQLMEIEAIRRARDEGGPAGNG